MKLTHTQARKRIEATLDRAPSAGRKPALDPDLAEHLSTCVTCRAYAEQTAGLETHLAQYLPYAWQYPRVTNQNIEATIQKVHDRSGKTQSRTRQYVWQGIQHTWRWGLGLAGILCLVGIIFAGMRLLPHNSAAPGAKSITPISTPLPTEMAILAPTATQTPQESSRPEGGEWIAPADFGDFRMIVDNTGTQITKVDYHFTEWTWCGTIAPKSSEVVDAGSWAITGNEFTVYSRFEPDWQNTITLHGTYDPESQRFSGTWEAASQGTRCSGVWQASLKKALTIWIIERTTDHFQRWLEKYQAENPAVAIITETIPISTTYEMVNYSWKSALAAGNGPDLFLVSNSFLLAGWSSNNLALPLNAYLSGKTDDFLSPLITDLSRDGQLYGIPYSTASMALYYNKSLLPDPPTSLDALASLVQQGQKIAMLDDYFSMFPFFTAFGGQIVDSDGRCIADQSDGMLQSIQYLQRLAQSGAVITNNPLTTAKLFQSGQAAMIIDGSWNYPANLAALGENLGVASIPPGSAPAIQITDGTYWVINPNSYNPQLAVDFALYIASHDAQAAMTLPDIPVRVDLLDSMPAPMNIFLNSAATGFPYLRLTKNNGYLMGFMDGIFYENEDPALALRDACKRMNFYNGK